MVYNTEDSSHGNVSFPSFSKIHEERIPSKYSSYFYGAEQNEPLQFSITFGLEPDLLDRGEYLSRDHIAMITAWLKGSGGYQRFDMIQDDMFGYYYMVRVSELTLLTNGLMPYGFSCVFSCDSPFAYTEETQITWDVSGEEELLLWNGSTYNGYYMPKMRVTKVGYGDISIINSADDDYEFRLSDVDDGDVIYVDNSKQIIINETTGENMYSRFNFKFFRMRPGDNTVILKGNYVITFLLSFPVDIGA